MFEGHGVHEDQGTNYDSEIESTDPTRNDGKRDDHSKPDPSNPPSGAPTTVAPYASFAGQLDLSSLKGLAGGGATKVNVRALEVFANNLEILITPMRASYQDVVAIAPVAAGAFPSAIAIRAGVGTLKEGVGAAMKNFIDALLSLQAAVRKIAADYQITGEINDMEAAKLTEYLAEVNSVIAKSAPTSGK